jgi:hypothetical protein
MQQISLFTGGAITENAGAFIQGTYDGVAHRFAWDNTDIRYAKSVKMGDHTFLWGIDTNNNPTVQDVWNTVPAWSFPYISSFLAPMPTASPFIDQIYAQQVGGISTYGFLDDIFYLEPCAVEQHPAGTRGRHRRAESARRHRTLLAICD